MSADGEIGERGEDEAEVVAGVQVSGAADAPAFGHFFGDESAAHGPFAADANAGEETKDRELPDVGDESTEESEGGIPDDGEQQGADAAEFIADGPPEEGATPADEEKGEEEAAVVADVSFGGGDAGAREEIAEGRDENEGVDDGVHAVESPAAPGGPEAADLIGGECGGWIRFVGHRGSRCLCAAAGYSGRFTLSSRQLRGRFCEPRRGARLTNRSGRR